MERGETHDDELQERDSTETPQLSEDERHVVTQAYDLSIRTLVEQWDSNLLVLPELEREYLWDDGKASRLIESLILRIPVPAVYVSEDERGIYEIVDGHQRIYSIVRYMKNQFPLSGLWVLGELADKRFHQLPSTTQHQLEMRILRMIVILHESSPNMKYEVFHRLNTGSITLNSQELRNAIFHGSLNQLLKGVVTDPTFRRLVGTGQPRRRMVDEELVLRFLALRECYDQYKPPLAYFLNDFAKRRRSISDEERTELSGAFLRPVSLLGRVFQRTGFRFTDDAGLPVEKAVNRALFDAQMLAFSWVQGEIDDSRSVRVRREIQQLYQNGPFRDATQRATGDRSRLRLRVREMAGAISRAGLQVHPDFPLEG